MKMLKNAFKVSLSSYRFEFRRKYHSNYTSALKDEGKHEFVYQFNFGNFKSIFGDKINAKLRFEFQHQF